MRNARTSQYRPGMNAAAAGTSLRARLARNVCSSVLQRTPCFNQTAPFSYACHVAYTSADRR